MNSSTSLKQSVIFIVHGFRSDSSSTNQMAKVLTAQHKVVPIDLDITYQNLEKCTAQLNNVVVRYLCKHPTRCINFVAHSTGGIVVRMLLEKKEISNIVTTCVFIAVPNNGTPLADAHQTILPKPLRGIHKPVAGLTRDFVRSLDLKRPPHIAYGGIAGLKPWRNTKLLFKGPNDGVVASSSVFLEGMVDFIQVPCDHLSIMEDYTTTQAVLNFLSASTFKYYCRNKPVDTAEKFKFIFVNQAMKRLTQQCSHNIEFETFGGNYFWDNLAEVDGWKLQQNKVTNHLRILNPSHIRQAWGSKNSLEDAMDLVISQIHSNNFIEKQLNSQIESRLEQLKLLLEKGIITQEDFENRKEKILNEL